MYPENSIRSEFWYFVLNRAADQRISVDEPGGSTTLIGLELREYVIKYWMPDEISEQEETEANRAMEAVRAPFPKTYATLQEALLAFLINEVATGDFRYDYATWLRVVALVLAEAARNPDKLLVIEYDKDREEGQREREHRMTVSETDWDCLSRDTFRFIRRTYADQDQSTTT